MSFEGLPWPGWFSELLVHVSAGILLHVALFEPLVSPAIIFSPSLPLSPYPPLPPFLSLQPHPYYKPQEKPSAVLPPFPDVMSLSLPDTVPKDKVSTVTSVLCCTMKIHRWTCIYMYVHSVELVLAYCIACWDFMYFIHKTAVIGLAIWKTKLHRF